MEIGKLELPFWKLNSQNSLFKLNLVIKAINPFRSPTVGTPIVGVHGSARLALLACPEMRISVRKQRF